MKFDWIEWDFFLKTLSAERTGAFIGELALPFEAKAFPKVMRLARSCLEFVIYHHLNLQEEPSGSQNLTEAWRRYRDAEGVLNDAKLREYEERYDGSLTVTVTIFSEPSDLIDKQTARALKNWFANNFRTAPDPAWQWLWALRLLVTDSGSEIMPMTPSPLDGKQRHYVEEFCAHYQAEKSALEMRFYGIEQTAKVTGASLWEKVLQNYPPEEGTLEYFPWLDNVEHSLQYRLIRYEWEKLRLELGPDVMTQLTDWIRMNSAILPFKPTMSNEPPPL